MAVSIQAVEEQLQAVLAEAFEGPPGPWSHFTDGGRGAGLFGSLEHLSAADASRVIAGTSIAAHVHHTLFALHLSARWIRGEREPADWPSSWRVRTVDERAWTRELSALSEGFEALKAEIAVHWLDDVEAVGAALGALAHAAYHLGAVRQKLAFLAAEARP
jgi:hypothetical protein